MMTVAWTGHRPDLFADQAAAQRAVSTLARELLESQATLSFVVGGQRGVDTWAAQAAAKLDVPFALILPLEPREFARGWSDTDRHLLETALATASRIHVVGGDPAYAFSERNRLLVADADLLLAVWTGASGGGTAETIAFAHSSTIPVREVLLTPSTQFGRASGRGI